MKQASLSRVVGSHLSLLGMAAYTLMSGPASAFAATTTDTETLTITANVGNYIAMTQTLAPTALTLTPPATGTTVNTASTNVNYTVNTNTSNGYKVNISAAYACGAVFLCSGATQLPQTFTTVTALGANAAALTNAAAANSGLAFRVVQTSAGVAAAWGTGADAANTKYAGVPNSSIQVLTNPSPGAAQAFNTTFLVGVPSGQTQGTYTSGVITLTAVTNS